MGGKKKSREDDGKKWVVKRLKIRPVLPFPAKAGQIIELSVTNFRDIDDWRGPLNQNANFFRRSHSEAMFLVLGGDPNQLLRPGRKLESFVKNKQKQAIISITVCGEQEDGNNIEIQCIISGKSNFRLIFKIVKGDATLSPKNEKEMRETVKSKMYIDLDHLALPMNSVDPQDIFQVLLASGLSKFENSCSRTTREMDKNLKDKEKYLNVQQKGLAELQEARKKLELLDERQEKLIVLNIELQRSMDRELNETKNNVQKHQNDLKANQNKIQQGEKNLAEYKTGIQDIQENIEKNYQALAEARNTEERHRKSQCEKKQQKQRLEGEIMDLTKQLDDLDEKKKELEEGLEQDNQFCEFKKFLGLASSAKKKYLKMLQELQPKVASYDAEINEMLKVPERSDQVSNHPDAIFGRNIFGLLHVIKASSSEFKHEPRGPLGWCVNLKKPNWASVVMAFIGKDDLWAFYVDNSEDELTLSDIMDEYSWGDDRPRIICNSFSYERSSFSHENGFENLLDMMGIEDPEVANYFKNQRRFHRVFLKDTIETDFTIPRNCDKVLNMQGDIISGDPKPKRLELLDAESQKPIAMHIEELRNECSGMMEKLKSLKKERNKCNEKLMEINNLWEIMKQDVKQTESIQRQNSDFTALQECMKAIEDLKNTIDEKQSKKWSLQQEIVDLEANILEVNKADLENQQDALKHDDKSWKDKWSKQEKELVKLRKASNDINDNLQKALEDLKNLEAKIAAENFTVQSVEEYPEVNSNRSSVKIIEEREQVEELIRVAQKVKIANIQQIDAAISKKSEEVTEVAQSVTMLQKDLRAMKESALNFNIGLGDVNFKMANQEYGHLLHLAGLEGELIIDSTNRAIRITPNSSYLSECQELYRNVCLLLALYKSMTLSFYVFNNIKFPNESKLKTLAMDIVLQHIRQHADRQFIFFAHLDNWDSLPDDRITCYGSSAQQPTAGTSSQSDE